VLDRKTVGSARTNSQEGVPGPELTQLQKQLLVHLAKFGPDTPWLISRRLLGASGWSKKVDEALVESSLLALQSAGLVDRHNKKLKMMPTSSIKPWMKLKQKNRDNRPRGIYYTLTRKGRLLASELKHELY